MDAKKWTPLTKEQIDTYMGEPVENARWIERTIESIEYRGTSVKGIRHVGFYSVSGSGLRTSGTAMEGQICLRTIKE
jgi:hypothetical protein